MTRTVSKLSLLFSLKSALAFCVKNLLVYVLTPLTGFLQRQNIPSPYDLAPISWKHQILSPFVKCLSWCCHGAITLAYPHMQYNPVTARQDAATWQWASAITDIPSSLLEQKAVAFLSQQNHRTDSLPYPSSSKESPTFTILICFYHHLNFFKNCLDSIEEACKRSPETAVEIFIINDDPSIDLATFLESREPWLKEKIILHTHSQNLGICRSANEALSLARGTWILHLDCDDLLEPTVFLSLKKTIQEYPFTRFISSRCLDIDTEGHILFWRLRSERPPQLIFNNYANHLKVIRKDLHDDLGSFNADFEGCQDYELALRTALNEPLCFIPDYLYQYRWHRKSQTVSCSKRQNFTAMRIRQTYLLAIFWLTEGTTMLHWKITGPHADSWKKITTATSSSPTKTPKLSYEISLEAALPYTDVRWRLLLVKIATIMIDRYHEKKEDTTIGIII